MRPTPTRRRRLTRALAAALILGLPPAKSRGADCALTYDQARATAVAAQTTYSEFGGEAAAALMRALSPGYSAANVNVERLLVTEPSDEGVVRIAVVLHECVVGVASFDERKWREWRALTFGSGG
jgi:hypothetical protein